MVRYSDGNNKMQRVWPQNIHDSRNLSGLWSRSKIDPPIFVVLRQRTDFAGGCAVADLVFETVLARASEYFARFVDQSVGDDPWPCCREWAASLSASRVVRILVNGRRVPVQSADFLVFISERRSKSAL